MVEQEPLDYRLVRQLQARVAGEISRQAQHREAGGERELSRADEQQLAISLIAAAVAEHLQQRLLAGDDVPVDRGYDDRLATGVYSAMFGAGELSELLDDQAVENININGCDEVWVTYAGEGAARRRPPVAATDEDLIEIGQALGAHAGVNARPWTLSTPELDLRLPDGSRLSAVMGAGERPSISIRRNRFPQMFLSDLVGLGTIDEQLAAFLRAAVLARCNIIVCGATNSGKTTLLRGLINEIPAHERLIVVEKALELGLRRHPDLHPNTVEWEMVLPDAEGHGGLSMAQLVRRSLRQDPSRCIVGEVLGEEIVTMLNAMSQGNDGSLSTLHARSSVAALDRIASYAAQSDGLSFEVTHSMIAGAIDFIVFIRVNPSMANIRTVAEVIEVAGFDGERATPTEIFMPSPADGRAQRTDKPLTPERGKRLLEVGFDPSPPGGGW